VRKIFFSIFLVGYTIFFIHTWYISKTGDVSLFFVYFNFPSSIVFFKIFDIGNRSAMANNIIAYLTGVFQYGVIGYFLGWIVNEML
jgi:hypothetical protein